MNAFDEMTLGEVEEMTSLCLGGASFEDAPPMQLAGAVMFFTKRREQPGLQWDDFKSTVKMGEIREFSVAMQDAEDENPTNGVKQNPD